MFGICVISFWFLAEGQMGSLNRGVQGLKELGVRELTYKLVFLASSVNPAESKHRTSNIVDETEEDVAR